jgi:hypothetical protein
MRGAKNNCVSAQGTAASWRFTTTQACIPLYGLPVSQNRC